MRTVWMWAALAAAASLAGSGAEAQGFKGVGKYSSSIVENSFPINPTNFSFTAEKSKVAVKPSGKNGDGGIVTQLNMKFVDCAADPQGNDGGAGTCGPKGTQMPEGVMQLDVIALGADLPGVAGIPFYLEKGKSRFVATGKNKQGGAAFGATITVLFQQPLGIGAIKIRTAGSDMTNPTTGCGIIPLPPLNTCTDGALWAFAGVRVGEDQDLSCTTTIECDNGGAAPTLICQAGACVPEPCTMDGDCDQNGSGSGGSGECGSDGFCCDPDQDLTCAGQM